MFALKNFLILAIGLFTFIQSHSMVGIASSEQISNIEEKSVQKNVHSLGTSYTAKCTLLGGGISVMVLRRANDSYYGNYNEDDFPGFLMFSPDAAKKNFRLLENIYKEKIEKK